MQWMINLKTPREIERMKPASRIVAEILLELREVVRDGITTGDIDRLAEEKTLKRNAKPAFKGYRGFPASICVSINSEVVHGEAQRFDAFNRVGRRSAAQGIPADSARPTR